MQETTVEGVPQTTDSTESSPHVIKGLFRLIKLAVESASEEDVSADLDWLMWIVPHAASIFRRFAVGRYGKTEYERNVRRRVVPPLAQFGERVCWMSLHHPTALWVMD